MTIATPGPVAQMPAPVVDIQQRIRELTGQIVAASMNDPTQASELTRELSKLLKAQSDTLVERATKARVEHQGEIEGVVVAAQEQIAEYAKTNNLPSFTVGMGFGFADEKMNGHTFNWSGKSAKGKRRGAGGGRKQPGVLKQNGKVLAAYDSATAAVRALAAQGVKAKVGSNDTISIPLHPTSNKPTRNAALVLTDAGYEWEKTAATAKATAN